MKYSNKYVIIRVYYLLIHSFCVQKEKEKIGLNHSELHLKEDIKDIMREKKTIANFKCYKGSMTSILDYFQKIKSEIKRNVEENVVFCVPYLSITTAVNAVIGTNMEIGAQNMYIEEGAYTGEISPKMLQSAGARYVILGHSERRNLFGESDILIKRKIDAALENGLTPILCVGENAETNEIGITSEWLRMQLRRNLKGIKNLHDLIIAYEPIWAIGTGKVATPEQAQKACKLIRIYIYELFGERVADELTILYGGSVKASNAAELFAQPDIDGALVGGASLNPIEFAEICNINV